MVTTALLHDATDSSLPWDAVPLIVRLLRAADALIGGRRGWRVARPSARRSVDRGRSSSPAIDRVQHYRELIKLTEAILAYADQAATLLWQAPGPMTSPRGRPSSTTINR